MHRGQLIPPGEAVPARSSSSEDRIPGDPYGIGIDIGDQTIAAATCGNEGVAAPLPLGATVVVPACVQLLPDGKPQLIDPSATIPDPARPVLRNYLSRVGVPVPLQVSGRPVHAPDVVASVVSAVQAVAEVREGRPPSWTVLTVPPSWGPHRCAVLSEALTATARSPVSLASTAVAAARSQVAVDGVAPVGTLAVYDLGASTLDTAVVRISEDGAVEHLAEPPAPLAWGGRDIDDAVLGHIRSCLGLPPGAHITPEVRRSLVELRARCVAAKEALSSDTDVRLDVELPTGNTVLRLVREDLEELLVEPVQTSLDALRNTVEAAGLRIADLDGVILVGGAGRMPLIAELLSAALDRPVLVPADPALGPALGAAQLAVDLMGTATPETADGEHITSSAAAVPLPADPPEAELVPAGPAPERSADVPHRRPAVRRPPAGRPQGAPRSPAAGGRRSASRVLVVAALLAALLLVPASMAALQSWTSVGSTTADAGDRGQSSGWSVADRRLGSDGNRTDTGADTTERRSPPARPVSGLSLAAAERTAPAARTAGDREPLAAAAGRRTVNATPGAATAAAPGAATTAPASTLDAAAASGPPNTPAPTTPAPTTPAPTTPAPTTPAPSSSAPPPEPATPEPTAPAPSPATETITAPETTSPPESDAAPETGADPAAGSATADPATGSGTAG